MLGNHAEASNSYLLLIRVLLFQKLNQTSVCETEKVKVKSGFKISTVEKNKIK